MTIHLPNDVERSIDAAVRGGRFASADELIARAVRSYLHTSSVPPAADTGHGLIGALRDDAELLDQAVEHAMRMREEQPWRLSPGE